MRGQRKYRRVDELEGEQRAAAEAEANAVVAAGAGSGKTTVLAARYVRLLEIGRLADGRRVMPRNVLVLTFTRKAAAEMYGRIYGSLAESASLAKERVGSDPDEAGRPSRAELAAHLGSCLASFSQAQISTFDSFASRIARSGSARFGVAPDFDIDEERAREAASELALSFILEHREEEAIRDLVSAIGLGGARDGVLADLALRRMSLSSPPDFEAFHRAQAGRLEEMLARSREGILAMREAVLEYEGAKMPDTSRAWVEAMAKDPGESEAEFLAFVSPMAGLRKPGSNSKDEAARFLSDSVDGIKAAIASYRDIAATKAAHPSRLGLYRRLDDFRRDWDSTRRASKILTFRDVAQLAYDTLVADDDVRRYYQGLYRYLMIDEFQDDDELQKRILYLLASRPGSDPSSVSAADLEPDRLFFVGDEKQSIYLFRGADVSVFRRLSGELAGREASASAGSPSGGSGSLTLSRNYRSEPGVIGMINAIFPSVMAPSDPEGRREDFEAAFEPLGSREATPGVESRFVYLERPRSEGGSGSRSAAECEAWEVARIVRGLVESGSFMVADRKAKAARPARYEDFAVLLRSTGNQVHFEKYFRLLDVPYGSENACGLFSEAVACDLYYALRLALYPGDRNALAAYLRSPFAGLSDESVVRILLASADNDGAGGGDAAGRAPAPGFDALRDLIDERERGAFDRGAATMAALAAMVDRAPIASALCALWYDSGYRAALLRDPVASAFEEHFELLHSMAIAADEAGRSLASFVAELESLVGKPDKLELDLPRESSKGVRIMTVHKSKGLEFPVVIVPQANNVGQDRSAWEAWYWEEGLGPTFKPPASAAGGPGQAAPRSRNAFFEASKERRTAMERAELKRLLYVALTRAESHVIVTATEPRSSDLAGKSFRGLLAGPLGLFAPPSPLAPSDGEPSPLAPSDGAAAEPRPLAAGASPEGFGPLLALPSGVLVGTIPERGELEYLALVTGSRGKAAQKLDFTRIPVIERPAASASTSVTALAERYAAASFAAPGRAADQGALGDRAEAIAPSPEAAARLEIEAELAAPEGIESEAWGSLVHAALEAAFGQGPGASRSLETLGEALEGRLGSAAAASDAVERAKALAGVFLASPLGRRALASRERYVELKVAMALEREKPPRYARGSIDLAFVEEGRVVVVDYKTDAFLAADAHELQIAAYERAASEIFGLPAEAWLFYLYGGGRALRVNAKGDSPRLELALEKAR